MAYIPFNEAVPDGSRTGPQTITDIRSNQQAMRDMIISGASVGWGMIASGASSEEPTLITYSKGLERIKCEVTWGTSGGATGNIQIVVYSYSLDSGSNYDPMDTMTIYYSTGGDVTSIDWT